MIEKLCFVFHLAMDDDQTYSNFLDRMKKATQSDHDVHDMAVNALFAFSLYTGGAAELWFEAMTRYEIVFTELEDALENVPELQSFDIPGIRLKHVIKSDLDQFLGADRKPINSQAINRYRFL